MRKYLIISIFGLIILVLVVGFLIWRRKPPVESKSIPEPEGVIIETPLEERPFVSLTPRADGKEFTLEIERIRNAETIEYELVYLSKGFSRGVIGSIDLDGETSVSRKLLLGTCSRGVCKYDEGVENGTLTLRFRESEGVRKFMAGFHLQQGGEELTSIDGNFKLEGQFSPDLFYLIMSTIGLPQAIEGRVVGQPYGVFTSGSKKIKKSTVTLSLPGAKDEAKIYFWSGKKWTPVADSVDALGVFVAVASE